MANDTKQKDNTNGKVSFLHSLAFRVSLIVTIVSAVAIILVSFIAINDSQDTLENTYKNYTMNVADTACAAVDAAMEATSQNIEVEGVDSLSGAEVENYLVQLLEEDPDANRETVAATFTGALGDVNIEGIEGSYAYLVAQDGTMVWHPTAEKIGGSVENEAVKGLVARLAAGETPEQIGRGSIIYLFKGAKKYAGYSFTSAGNILIVTGDYDKVMQPVTKLVGLIAIASIIIIILMAVAFFIIIRKILNPLTHLVDIIDNTARFDFTHTKWGSILRKRKDEIGVMAKAVASMRVALREMVGQISDTGSRITENVDQLRSTTDDVNSMCTDNSATTQELAASMEEASAATETINNNVADVQEEAKHIDELTTEGTKMSVEIMGRAAELKKTTETASNRTRSTYETVRTQADRAIESSKAVDKINELTNTINEIASQTSLLALNASIEAARAGEAGKGFAVVATEIGKLADQTTSAVANIDEIVKEVNEAVGMMSECLTETTDFLEKDVLNDYSDFQNVSEQYQQDADSFKSSMADIKAGISALSEAINAIALSLNDINMTVGDSANGVTDIAQKTTGIVDGTSDVTTKVADTKNAVALLDDIVSRFNTGE
ncbi:MAG: methyl-accepting chemotaxis protein [Lachnospiraceae bacterium]|nr:methyl-accepting chemotaxis protein [Lachnospiraceae bacterium]